MEQTLSQKMQNALRYIEHGAVPDKVVPAMPESDDDDDVDDDMVNIKVLRPSHQHILDSVLTEEAEDLVGAKDVLEALKTASQDKQSTYRTQALKTEVAFKNMLPSLKSAPEKRALQLSCEASTVLNKAFFKFKRVLAWQDADTRRHVDERKLRTDTALGKIDKVLNLKKQQDREDIQAYIEAWTAIVQKYMSVLDSATVLLAEMVQSKETGIVRESTRIVGTLTAVIKDILQEAVQRVTGVDDPEDAFKILSVLRHAIQDSTQGVQDVLRDSIGIRPDFDERRNRELEDALAKTRRDIEACEKALADTRKPKDDSLDGLYTQKTAASGLEARLAAAKRLEEILANDLKDAEVQKIIVRLNAVCQRQATWQEASGKLAALCEKKYNSLKKAYSVYERAKYIEQELADKELETLEKVGKQGKAAALSDLLKTLSRELHAFDQALNALSHSVSASVLKIIKQHLYARVLLEFAMLH